MFGRTVYSTIHNVFCICRIFLFFKFGSVRLCDTENFSACGWIKYKFFRVRRLHSTTNVKVRLKNIFRFSIAIRRVVGCTTESSQHTIQQFTNTHSGKSDTNCIKPYTVYTTMR